MPSTENTLLRIGELSRRSGVSPELLRAWERRYGLVRPLRSPGGLRLYSLDDLDRVRVMRGHIAGGLAAAEAAALAAHGARPEPATGEPALSRAREELAAAIAAFDEAAAQAAVDRVLAATTVDTFLAEVVMPYLHELGERWERGDASIAEEHFASSLLRGRLLGLARGWGQGVGRYALLACPPGELHDLALIALGIALRSRGWRIAFLGADTPVETLVDAADTLAPAVVVLSAVAADRFEPVAGELAALARRHRLALAGAGASADIGPQVLVLRDEPVVEAERLSTLFASG
jgi:DNA-binding transcriptional MerR regulator